VYFLGSGAYRNWPEIAGADEIVRLFIGVNAVGGGDGSDGRHRTSRAIAGR
jgi:hypothetical protein